MSRIAVAALGVALMGGVQLLTLGQLPAPGVRVTAERLPVAAQAVAAPRVAASPQPTHKASPKPPPKPPAKPKKPAPPAVPVPVAEMPGPTQGCPGTAALSRITQLPWAQRALSFSSVWPLSRGQGVTVAVVDSGVDFSRQLAGRVTAFDLTNTGLQDCVGHGTAVAAIIAASDIQAQGMPFEGVAPAARILSVKVNSQSTGNSAVLAKGIIDAVIRGAKVINVSITTSDSPQLRSAVEYALRQNVVIVAAGGNDGTTTGTGPFYPASYPGVLSVGAVDATGALAPFSDQRSHVAVTAPGVNVTSAFPGGYQNQLTGTSFATPFVSGVAALVRARFPRLSAAQVVNRIEATADGSTGPGTGNGLVSPVEAVTAILGGRAAGSPPSGATPRAVSVSRTLPPDRTARVALEVAGGALATAGLVGLGAVIISQGRRRRWRAGRMQIPADGGPSGRPWP